MNIKDLIGDSKLSEETKAHLDKIAEDKINGVKKKDHVHHGWIKREDGELVRGCHEEGEPCEICDKGLTN